MTQIRNYFIFPSFCNLRKNFVVKNDNIYFFNNFDLINKILLSRYAGVEISNFFVHNIHLNYDVVSLKVDLDYITEILDIGEYIAILGFKFKNLQLIVNFYSISDNKIKFTKVFPLKNSNRVFDNACIKSVYCSFVVRERTLCTFLNGEIYFELEVKNGKLVTNSFNDDKIKLNLEINYLSCDNFKFTLAAGDHTIKVYSARDKKLWYTLLSGSLNVMPKSFIADPNVKGFSKVIITKTSIIASIGNLIRQYDFNLN